MTLKEKYLYCKEHNIDFILKMDELEEINNEGKEIQSIDDLVMVHKTSYAPKGKIQTTYEAGGTLQKKVKLTLNQKTISYDIEIPNYRKTVHFTLNGQVVSHTYLNKDDAKYAVIMPLNNNKEKIVEGSETDLYTYGSVGLKSDAIILCPENEVEQIKKENPNSTVVGYQGETVTPYVDVFVSQVLGYKYKKPTEKARNWDHGNGEDHETAERIIKENGWKYTDHYYSDYMKQENLEEQIDNFIAIIQIIMKDNLLFDEENMKSIIKKFNEDLGNNGYFYNIPNKLEYISKRIEEKTKIKMLDGSNDSPKLISAEELTNILRYVALTKKYEQGLLTESEKNTFLKNLDISKIRDEDIDYFIRQIDEKIEKVGIGGVLIPKLHRNDKEINMNLMIEDKNYLDAMIPLINFINAAAKSRVSVSYDSLKPKEKMLHLIEVAKEYSDTHIRGIDENDEIITDFNVIGCKNIIEIEQKVFDLIETMEKNENYICPEDIAEFGLDIEDGNPNTNIKKATK